MNKSLWVVFILLAIGSYFLYDYQSKAIIESKKEVIPENIDVYADSPLSPELREIIHDFWKYTGKDTIQAGNGMQVMGEEKKLSPNTITLLLFYREKDYSYISLQENYYFTSDRAVSYTFLDDNLIVYCGNDGVQQNLLDTTKMLTDFDFLEKYNAEGKPLFESNFKHKLYELK